MNRPTKEQVDLALRCASEKYAEVGCSYEDFYRMPDVLASEVRHLRDDLSLAQAGEQDAIDRCAELRAKLARVEALLTTTAFGRSKPEPVHEHAMISAVALRAALRGEG